MAERTRFKRAGYSFLRSLCRFGAVLFLRYRCIGREHEPVEGGALVCSNHQSFFDPILIGLSFKRQMNYLARETLFRFAPFRWLIKFLDAIPIDREGMGLSGLKETLRRLKRGELVLIFPEGTRSRDGEVSSLKLGFVALARRGRTPLLPVAVDGAYDAWPRHATLPRRATVCVVFGEAISLEMIKSMNDQQLIEELERRIRSCHEQARRSR